MRVLSRLSMAILSITVVLGTWPAMAVPRIEAIKVELSAAGYEVPENEDVLTQIVLMETSQGKEMSAHEVAMQIEHISGVVLKKNCFTCRMRVLTPRGYRAIGKLLPGDPVFSWNEGARRIEMNEVLQVHDHPDKPFGILEKSPTGIRLEVSATHSFLMAEENIYKELGNIPLNARLRAVALKNCEGVLWQKSAYNANAGAAVLRTITVARPPYNYIVEGLVVHNKPIEAL